MNDILSQKYGKKVQAGDRLFDAGDAGDEMWRLDLTGDTPTTVYFSGCDYSGYGAFNGRMVEVEPDVVLFVYHGKYGYPAPADVAFADVDASAYDALVVRPTVALSDRVFFRVVDAGLIDRVIVDGSANTVRSFADGVLKRFQTGFAQSYLFLMIVGAIAIVGYLLR